jgi:putative NADH-flavin reductase
VRGSKGATGRGAGVRILILGATGGTGQHATREALARGHEVTVLVRNRARLPKAFDRLRIHDGDARDATAVASAVADQDAVISVLGCGAGRAGLTPNGLIASTAPILVQAMQQGGVRRLVFTSAFGVGVTKRDVPMLPRLFIASLLRHVYADKAAGEASVQHSALDWTIVYPTMLTDGPKTGRLQVAERLALRGMPTISRADVGAVLVSLLESPDTVRKGVMVAQG